MATVAACPVKLDDATIAFLSAARDGASLKVITLLPPPTLKYANVYQLMDILRPYLGGETIARYITDILASSQCVELLSNLHKIDHELDILDTAILADAVYYRRLTDRKTAQVLESLLGDEVLTLKDIGIADKAQEAAALRQLQLMSAVCTSITTCGIVSRFFERALPMNVVSLFMHVHRVNLMCTDYEVYLVNEQRLTNERYQAKYVKEHTFAFTTTDTVVYIQSHDTMLVNNVPTKGCFLQLHSTYLIDTLTRDGFLVMCTGVEEAELAMT